MEVFDRLTKNQNLKKWARVGALWEERRLVNNVSNALLLSKENTCA